MYCTHFIRFIWPLSQLATQFAQLKICKMHPIDVALSISRQQRFEVPESYKVWDLKSLAQKSFGKGFLRLVTAHGEVLSELDKSLQAAGLQDEDHLTAMVLWG